MKRKSLIAVLVTAGLAISMLAGCSSSSQPSSASSTTMATSASESTSYATSSSSSAKSSTSNKNSSFTNEYGTSSTKCAHSGCNNPIASSGDTNCCATHSNKCLECGKYIDEDAMYCMSCLKKATQSSSSSSSKSSGKVSGSGSGGYDMPNENDESFSDYVKRVDPDLYNDLFTE